MARPPSSHMCTGDESEPPEVGQARMALSLVSLHGCVGRCRVGWVYRAEKLDEGSEAPSAFHHDLLL